MIVGDVRLGRTLTCSTGDWDGDYAYTVEWLRDGVADGTGATRVVSTGDVLHELRCRVQASGLTTADSRSGSPPLRAPRPRLPSPVTRGSARSLTCGTGAWDGDLRFTYEWFRGDGTTVGATATAHRRGRRLRLYCKVTAAGLTTVSSADVTVTGAPGAQPENRTPPR